MEEVRDHERAFVPSLVKSVLTTMRDVASAHVCEVKREYLREPQSAWAPPTDNMRRWRQTLFRYIVNYSSIVPEA